MRIFPALLLAGCASFPRPDPSEVRAELQDPAKVFPAFQGFVRCGDYAHAYDLLSTGARRTVTYEEFFFAMTALEASRRLIGSARVHGLDAAAGKIRLCSTEFGVGRDFGLAPFAGLHLLDLTPADIEYFKDHALEWHRLQVRKADGWHFAYPPDWAYAPLTRTCICGEKSR